MTKQEAAAKRYFREAYLMLKREKFNDDGRRIYRLDEIVAAGFETTGIGNEHGEIYMRGNSDRIIYDSETGFIFDQYIITEEGKVKQYKFL